jgi:hypothetical protein
MKTVLWPKLFPGELCQGMRTFFLNKRIVTALHIVRLYIVKILVLLNRKSRNIIIEIYQFLLKLSSLNTGDFRVFIYSSRIFSQIS